VARLTNKTVMITGGAQGIGAAVAAGCVREGARVVIADLDSAGAQITVRRLGEGRAHAVKLDVRQPEDVRRAVHEATHWLGGIDILVNNAGVLRMGALLDAADEDWDLVFDVNLKGVFLCSREVVQQQMRPARSGSIVNMSSVAGKTGLPEQAAYSAAKAAVVNLSRVMAMEFAPFNVRVNAVCPGAVDTELFQECLTWTAEHHREDRQALLARWLTPSLLGRLIRPEEVANAVIFLASDESSAITGTTLNVDGGVAPY
jgi:NAD(P)-dependent dehydrogenase (short-subunit alcohol dehydrogenase family)